MQVSCSFARLGRWVKAFSPQQVRAGEAQLRISKRGPGCSLGMVAAASNDNGAPGAQGLHPHGPLEQPSTCPGVIVSQQDHTVASRGLLGDPVVTTVPLPSGVTLLKADVPGHLTLQ